MSYSFGFSWQGFIIVLLPMIPNIFYFMFPNVISSGNVEKKNSILDIIEHGSQIIYIGLLIFVINNRAGAIQIGYVIGMAIFLLLYYVLWRLLFSGKKNIMILLSLAIFPVVYFIYRRNFNLQFYCYHTNSNFWNSTCNNYLYKFLF